MTTSAPIHAARHFSMRALLVGVASALYLIAVPATAHATSRSVVTHAGKPTGRASSICGKVSAATISSLIGYKVPAGVVSTYTIKPTAANYHITGTNTVCTYGAEATMASALKAVSLTYEVTSKPLTAAEMQKSLEAVTKIAKFKFIPYTGLGVPGYYFSITEDNITGQGMTGIQDGTHFFGASVESKTVSKSTLAALTKLAAKL
jgi:hypothetical protein